MPAASDKYFVSDIEQTLPKGSAVFQLPYMDFPEPRIISGTMGTYEPMSLYLYSRDLYWSYGATRGRDVDKWDKTTTALPVKAMLAKLKPAGYSGIVIDTYGYQDKGQSIIHELNHELGKSPLISLDHHYVFYSLGSK
jgi:phosphoglycerol transferase